MNTREYMSAKIRELRLEKNLSQAELGQLLTTKKKGGTISSWENGRTMPDENALIDLCKVFNVDISAFYPTDRRNDDSALTSDESELIALFRAFSPEMRHAVMVGLRDYANNREK